MADKYLLELSAVTGLPLFENAKVVGDKATLIGLRDGFLVSAGIGKEESGSSAVLVLFRFPNMEDVSALTGALKAAKGGFKEVKVDNSSALAVWKYSLGKPKVADVAEALTSVLLALKQNAQPYDGRCEMCRGASVSEITLMNDVPGYYCAGCQEKTRAELGMAAEQYERLETNLPQGLLYGSVAALGGSVVWGGVAYLINYIFLYGAIIIGYAIGWAVHKGIGKINLAGQIMVGVLTVASVLFGDVIFYTLTFMKEMNLPFSIDLLATVMENFVEIETDSKGGVASIFFALIGAGYAVYSHRKPQFAAKFEPLGPPTAAGGDVMGMGAGK
jgi:hypothetical protein